jgi:dolichol-phosphate mannosyltransferase
VIHRPRKLGLGTAYVAGFRWGLARGYARFVQMDADFSHDPEDVPRFIERLDADADVVVGSRNVSSGRVEGWGPLRHLVSKGGSFYSRWVLEVNVRDLTTGFKAFTRHALELIGVEELTSNGYAFQIETTYRALRRGLRVVELPIVFVDRRAGQSKMSRHEVAEAIVAVWKMRSQEDVREPT